MVTVSGLRGSPAVEGQLDVVAGKQAIVISEIRAKAGSDSLPLGTTIVSLPHTIRIARVQDKNIVYHFDKPVATYNPVFGAHEWHGAGTFHFQH